MYRCLDYVRVMLRANFVAHWLLLLRCLYAHLLSLVDKSRVGLHQALRSNALRLSLFAIDQRLLEGGGSGHGVDFCLRMVEVDVIVVLRQFSRHLI